MGRWTGGRVTAVSVGDLACLLGLGAAAAGGALLVADQVSHNAAGFVSTGSQTFRTPTTALLTDADLTFDGPGWLSGPEQLGTVALTVRGGRTARLRRHRPP